MLARSSVRALVELGVDDARRADRLEGRPGTHASRRRCRPGCGRCRRTRSGSGASRGLGCVAARVRALVNPLLHPGVHDARAHRSARARAPRTRARRVLAPASCDHAVTGTPRHVVPQGIAAPHVTRRHVSGLEAGCSWQSGLASASGSRSPRSGSQRKRTPAAARLRRCRHALGPRLALWPPGWARAPRRRPLVDRVDSRGSARCRSHRSSGRVGIRHRRHGPGPGKRRPGSARPGLLLLTQGGTHEP
jgi:hypothetical protein